MSTKNILISVLFILASGPVLGSGEDLELSSLGWLKKNSAPYIPIKERKPAPQQPHEPEFEVEPEEREEVDPQQWLHAQIFWMGSADLSVNLGRIRSLITMIDEAERAILEAQMIMATAEAMLQYESRESPDSYNPLRATAHREVPQAQDTEEQPRGTDLGELIAALNNPNTVQGDYESIRGELARLGAFLSQTTIPSAALLNIRNALNTILNKLDERAALPTSPKKKSFFKGRFSSKKKDSSPS